MIRAGVYTQSCWLVPSPWKKQQRIELIRFYLNINKSLPTEGVLIGCKILMKSFAFVVVLLL